MLNKLGGKPVWPWVLNKDSPQARGLIGWYAGDANAGRFIDMSGFGNHLNIWGTIPTNGYWAPGKDGGNGALRIDGTTNWADMIPSGPFDNLPFLSVFLWMFMTSATGNHPPIIAKTPVWASGAGWSISEAITKVLIQDSGGTNFRQFNYANSLLNTGWQHIGFTWSVSGNVLAAYLNGKAAPGTLTTGGTVTIYNNPNNITLGINQANPPDGNFGGLLEDIKIYNRFLKPKEVADLYQPNTRWELRYVPNYRKYFLPLIPRPTKPAIGIRKVPNGVSAGVIDINMVEPVNKYSSLNFGLLGWWKVLNQTKGGAFFYDLLGRNNGKFVNMAFPPSALSGWSKDVRAPGSMGMIGLDGSDDYIDFGKRTEIQPLNTGTVSLWFKCKFQTANNKNIFGSADIVSNVNGFNFYQLSSATQVAFQLCSAVPSQQTTAVSINLNQWYHATITWNGTLISTYINGNLVATNAQTITPTSSPFGVICGANPANLVVNVWQGSVDSLKIYNRGLLPNEVTDLYNDEKMFCVRTLNHPNVRVVYPIGSPVVVPPPVAIAGGWWNYCGDMMGALRGGPMNV